MEAIKPIKVEKLEQLVNKNIYVGKLNITQLSKIIRYTSRKASERDPFDENYPNSGEDLLHYQRLKSSDRAYDIKLFFLKNISNKFNYEKNRISPLGTFPSSIILSLKTNDDIKSKNDYDAYLSNEDENIKEYSFIENEDLYIPKSKQALIVDGQHRIAGLELLLEETEWNDIKLKKSNKSDFQLTKNNFPPLDFIKKSVLEFEFIVTFLLDFDPYEQAEIFATVNFNQIKVNKSFYYDIFGSSTRSRSVEKLLHDIVSHLNYKTGSPLSKKIKMLGTGEGYISQSFLVDAFIPHFKNGTFSFIYVDFQKDGENYKLIPNFIKIYFEVLFDIYSAFMPNVKEKKYSCVLLKTTGMGALIKLLPNIFNKIKIESGIKDPFDVLKINDNLLKEKIYAIFTDVKESGQTYFGSDSDFSGGAGKGLQNKLYDLILDDLGIKNKNNDEQYTIF
jgi:hypothetical protein